MGLLKWLPWIFVIHQRERLEEIRSKTNFGQFSSSQKSNFAIDFNMDLLYPVPHSAYSIDPEVVPRMPLLVPFDSPLFQALAFVPTASFMSIDLPHSTKSTLPHRRRIHDRQLQQRRSRRSTCYLSETALFALFVKILLRYLKLVGEHERLRTARDAIRECVRCHRAGDPAYAQLRDTVEACLYWTTGPYHWSRAQRLFCRVCQRRGLGVDRG